MHPKKDPELVHSIESKCRPVFSIGLALCVIGLSACSTSNTAGMAVSGSETTVSANQSPNPTTDNQNENTSTQAPLVESLSAESSQDGSLPKTQRVQSNSQLSKGLLEDLLIANIASRRGQYKEASDALLSASYLSRNSKIITDGISLASISGNYARVIELSNLLKEIAPENPGVLLNIANAHFKLGNNDNALSALLELVETTSPNHDNDSSTLISIARLLVQQESTTIIQLFFQQVEQNRNNGNLNLIAAMVASNTDQMGAVMRFIDRSLESNSGWEQAAFIKFNRLLAIDPKAAELFARNFLKTTPSANQIRLVLARQLLHEQQLDQAEEELQLILKEEPESSEALFTSGLIYIQMNSLDKAKSAFQAILKIFPQHNQSKLYLAEIANRQKNYQEAIVYLQQVDGQQYIDAQISLARVLIKLKGVNAAIDYLQKLGARSDDDKIKLLLEQDSILQAEKLFDRLKRFLDDSLKQFPDQPDLLYNRGLLAAQMNLLELHERDLKRLLGLQPDNAHAYNALGYTLADKTDRLEEAMTLITRANELLPDNPFILDSLGWAYFRKGDNDAAIKYLRQALSMRQDPEIAAHLGEVLWVTGSREEATQLWMEAQSEGDENPVLQETIDRLLNEQQSLFFHLSLPLHSQISPMFIHAPRHLAVAIPFHLPTVHVTSRPESTCNT